MIYSEEHILVDAINAPVQYGKKGDCCLVLLRNLDVNSSCCCERGDMMFTLPLPLHFAPSPTFLI